MGNRLVKTAKCEADPTILPQLLPMTNLTSPGLYPPAHPDTALRVDPRVKDNPGILEELHKPCTELLSKSIEGARVIVSKSLSPQFEITHNVSTSALQPSDYGCTFVGDTISPVEPSAFLMGDADPSGNLNSQGLYHVSSGPRLVESNHILAMNLPLQTSYGSNPHLPNEVLFKILGYVDDPKDLLTWRTVSRAWNEITSDRIFQKGLPVEFFPERTIRCGGEEVDKQIQQFLETMEGRLQGTNFPFSKFELYLCSYQSPISNETCHSPPTLASFKKLADTVGPYVKHYVIQLEPSFAGDADEVFEVLLAQAPNLEKLSVYGYNDGNSTEVALNSSFHLPKLKYIEVTPCSKEAKWPSPALDFQTEKIEFDDFSSWFSSTPALQVVECSFGVRATSDIQATEYLRLLQNFDAVELELSSGDIPLIQKLIAHPLPTLHTLHLFCVDGAWIPRTARFIPEMLLALLKCTSTTLHRLKLYVEWSTITIPILRNLEVLELEFGEPNWDNMTNMSQPFLSSPLQAAQFPNLKSLTLKDNYGDDDNQRFLNKTFPN